MKNTVSLTEVIKENDELKTLKALQEKVAFTLDNTTSARDIAALTRQLRELSERIARMTADPVEEISKMLCGYE